MGTYYPHTSEVYSEPSSFTSMPTHAISMLQNGEWEYSQPVTPLLVSSHLLLVSRLRFSSLPLSFWAEDIPSGIH